MVYPSEFDLMRDFQKEKNRFLFHYTTYSSALGILLSRQMRMGFLVNMNDPLEFVSHRDDGIVTHGGTNEEVFSKLNQFTNAVIEKERSVRLASFSVDMPDNDQSNTCQENFYNNLNFGWGRSRMWAQYADNHKGVCLIFDRECIEKEFKDAFESKSCECFCKKVIYTNDLEPIRDALSHPCDSFLTADKIDFLFQKCQDFRDEQEYRLLLINKKLKDPNETVSFSIENSVCGVITGVKFPKENKSSLEAAIKSCNPQIRRFYVRWDYGMPNISEPARWLAMVKDLLDE